MSTVHRFRVRVTDRQVLQMPVGAEILHIDDQTGAGATLDLWALVDEAAALETRELVIVGTGNPVPADATAERHLGTVISRDGGLVWHLFDCTEASG